MQQLTGKVALITGGSRGIGAAIARRLAADGADIAFTYAQSEHQAHEVTSEITAFGGNAIAIRADNRSAEALESAVKEVIATYGGIDILINNAGIFPFGAITECQLDDIDSILAINVRAPLVATKAAAVRMREGGRIITIGSNLATRVPWPGISLYSMSKAALVGFTKGAARDLGSRDITVNIVHPGSTDTDMNPANGEMSDFQRAAMAIPRYNEPSDIAGLVAWIAGPESRSVTGAEFTIDGGSNA